MSKKTNEWIPPIIEGDIKPGHTYRAYYSKHTTKREASDIFKRLYGEYPRELFYGPPKGFILFAGPIPKEFIKG